MSLPIQKLRLSEVAEAGLDFGGVTAGTRTGTPPLRAIGECFAFHSEPLAELASREGSSWHEWFLRRALIGLWSESSQRQAFVCYTLHPGIVRVFFCRRQKRYPVKFAKIVSASHAYIERGQDGFPPQLARPLAFWESPNTAVALWPAGLRGETDGARVVDTGNAMAYFSYPESDHDAGIPVDEAGPEYIRVPQRGHAEFEWEGRVYRYLNRWAAVEMDLRPEAWGG